MGQSQDSDGWIVELKGVKGEFTNLIVQNICPLER